MLLFKKVSNLKNISKIIISIHNHGGLPYKKSPYIVPTALVFYSST